MNAELAEYRDNRLSFRHGESTKSMTCDALVVAKGWEPQTGPWCAFQAVNARKMFIIGDALQPRSLLEALDEGVKVAEAIDGLG